MTKQKKLFFLLSILILLITNFFTFKISKYYYGPRFATANRIANLYTDIPLSNEAATYIIEQQSDYLSIRPVEPNPLAIDLRVGGTKIDLEPYLGKPVYIDGIYNYYEPNYAIDILSVKLAQ